MNILLICLFIAVLLPYLAKLPVAFAMHRTGGYDNHHPRAQQASLTGFGGRAVAAHLNSFESLLIFSIAVLAALATHNYSSIVQNMAVLHIICRCLYHVIYLMNWASLRTIIWAISFIASLIILGSCLPG